MSVKHGHKKRTYQTGTYRSWAAMRNRCSPTFKLKAYYYDIGITICDRWQEYSNFYADMGDRPDGMTLDRIDSTKGYSPDNCRWATREQQAINRKHIKSYAYQGETKCLSEWGRDPRCAVSYATLYARVYTYKWNFIDALTQGKKRNQHG